MRSRSFRAASASRSSQAAVIDNPSIGNYEELGDLYLDDGQYAKARECFDRVIGPRTESPDPFYRRALSALALGDTQAAVDDLTRVVAIDPKYDYQRAAGLLAHALALLGRNDEAAERFADVTRTSTLVGDTVQLRVVPRRRPARPPRRVNGRSGFWQRSRRCRPTATA